MNVKYAGNVGDTIDRPGRVPPQDVRVAFVSRMGVG